MLICAEATLNLLRRSPRAPVTRLRDMDVEMQPLRAHALKPARSPARVAVLSVVGAAFALVVMVSMRHCCYERISN